MLPCCMLPAVRFASNGRSTGLSGEVTERDEKREREGEGQLHLAFWWKKDVFLVSVIFYFFGGVCRFRCCLISAIAITCLRK